ncbi:MAG: tRNA (N6-threonylcarbamoyladenosine(37)-N6)-methyltransferase TrmO [Clostridia bacterium]|nr:tRNA (N6-threonylcarbamoyladenosine(37)-N6)-methyltransferase TrmO [Clostridia bacterium]
MVVQFFYSYDSRNDMKIIARIHNDFTAKFGIPRQSGLAEVSAKIVFEPEYRNPDALRGLEGFSHLWLIWQFSEAKTESWSPTVRPPRLGGNTRMGVFATRSPYRPNPIGLSSVKLIDIEPHTPEGPILTVQGADLLDGTPIYDIKPYLAYTDAHPEAKGGFAYGPGEGTVQVECADCLLAEVPKKKRQELLVLLAQDPRPGYQEDPTRIYGMEYGGMEVRFTVADGILKVIEINIDSKKSK